jgi:hypothetical protein
MARSRRALFVTYTMADPYAVGVFFRAVRLATELLRRRWECVLYNYGPTPSDPKVDAIASRCEVIRLDSDDSFRDYPAILAEFRGIDPQVVLFGEMPLLFMVPLFRAAKALVRPPVLMFDQYYSPDAGAKLRGVDSYLMYGVRGIWPDPPMPRGLEIIPPFIDGLAPIDELPVPAALHGTPWITIVGFDHRVLRAGIDMVARLLDVPCACIAVSQDPANAERWCEDAGIPAGRRVSLPLQDDASYFGLIAASRAVILANGFMQIVEATALACPSICVDRGIGMYRGTLHPAFGEFALFAESVQDGAERLRDWLHRSPFTEAQLRTLRWQRGGAAIAADCIERAVDRPRLLVRWQRRIAFWQRALLGLPPSAAKNAHEIA